MPPCSSVLIGGGSAQTVRVIGVVQDAREQVYSTPIEPRRLPVRADALLGGILLPGAHERRRRGAGTWTASRARRRRAEWCDLQRGGGHRRAGRDVGHAGLQGLARLVGLFAAISLLLVSAGLYGVRSYAVALKRSEIGVRMAIGATRADIWVGTMSIAVHWCAAGLTFGWRASALLGAVASAAIAGAVTAAPSVFALAAAALTAACLAASALPARRASLVSAAELLRR